MHHFKLCKAILTGFRDQLRADGTYKDGFVGLMESGQEREAMAVMSVPIAPEEGNDRVYQLKDKSGSIMHVQINSEAIYRDDLTGQVLDPELVRIARAKELEYFEAKVVWERRMMGEARRVTGKPSITVRWVDVNKEIMPIRTSEAGSLPARFAKQVKTLYLHQPHR